MTKKLIAWVFWALLGNGVALAGPEAVVERESYKTAAAELRGVDLLADKSEVLFIGDSIIKNMSLDAFECKRCVNLGIIGDTTYGIVDRVKGYKLIKNASIIFLEGGVNDLPFGKAYDYEVSKNYERLISLIPSEVQIYILGILSVNEKIPKARPGWNSRIKSINSHVNEICRHYPNCKMIALPELSVDKNGDLLDVYLSRGDGIHLSKYGYEKLLYPAIKEVLP